MKKTFKTDLYVIKIEMENNMFSVSLDLPEEWGCTSPWMNSLFKACRWCINTALELDGGAAMYFAQEDFSTLFPKWRNAFEAGRAF